MTEHDQRPEIAIIGAGIVGAFVAYYLVKSGRRVTIIDPNPAEGASAGNAGILALSYSMPMSNPGVLLAGIKSLFGSDPAATLSRPMTMNTAGWLGKFAAASRPGRAQRDAPEIYGLATSSLRLYDEFATEEQVDLGLRRTGWLYLARTKRALATQTEAAEQLSKFGVRHTALDTDALRAAEPGLGPGHIGGLHFTDDASMDPALLTRSVLGRAIAHGASLIRERVVAVDRADKEIRSVITDSGQRIEAETFVIAGGGDSADIARMFGTRLPIERGYGWSLVLPTTSSLAHHALMGIDNHVVINPSPTSVRITGGMEFGGRAGNTPTSPSIHTLRSHAEELLPAIREVTDRGLAWRGARPMTPSGLPITEYLTKNLVAVTGHGTLGMTLAPASAQRAAQLLTHRHAA